MKGATGDPEKKIRTANKTMIRSIGTSHHFLFCFKKSQNSLNMLTRSLMVIP
jgi:hypothetical protein